MYVCVCIHTQSQDYVYMKKDIETTDSISK